MRVEMHEYAMDFDHGVFMAYSFRIHGVFMAYSWQQPDQSHGLSSGCCLLEFDVDGTEAPTPISEVLQCWQRPVDINYFPAGSDPGTDRFVFCRQQWTYSGSRNSRWHDLVLSGILFNIM